MKTLLWRIRFTIYGQSKTGWGLRLWWDCSSCAAEYIADGFSPSDAALEEIGAAS